MSPIALVVVSALVVVVLLLVTFVAVRSRRRRDGVDSFRRQIDALSPEARRTVVDQVQHAAERDPDEPGGDRGA